MAGTGPAKEVRAVSRRILIAFIAVLSLAVMASTASAAHHHAKRRHHAAKKHGNRRRARKSNGRGHAVVVVRRATETAPGGTEAANTVESFTEGVLKIKLAGGETVTGKVGTDTRLICVTPAKEEDGKDGGQGGEEGTQEDWGHGPWGPGEGSEDQEGTAGEPGSGHSDLARVHAADQQSGEGDQDDPEVQPCETTSLTAGAKVLFAQLAIGSSGAEWAVVVLSA